MKLFMVNNLNIIEHKFNFFGFLVKHNKITQGLVSQGQCAKDVKLFTLDGQSTTLFSQIIPGQPLVLLAGSTT